MKKNLFENGYFLSWFEHNQVFFNQTCTDRKKAPRFTDFRKLLVMPRRGGQADPKIGRVYSLTVPDDAG